MASEKYYLCNGRLINPRTEIPMNLKVGDMSYFMRDLDPEEIGYDYPLIHVVTQEWSKDTHYEWRKATQEEVALIQTHILLEK